MYQTFYQFSGKPFQLNPDPDFFFGSRGHRRAMAYLEYGLHQGEGFIVITGEVGAGKTTLVRNLLRRVSANRVVAAQIVSTQVSADDLLRLVAANFHISSQGLEKSVLLQRLENRFQQMHLDGKRALLMVDEAQNLSPRAVEELRMLSNFQIGSRSLVQSFLVGQPEFREILQRPEMRQLKQRVIASYHLGPLDANETQAYIQHRLTHVGWRDDPSFTAEAFERIHILTQGVPRRINTLCDRVLLSGYLSERHRIDASIVDEVSLEMTVELGLSRTSLNATPGSGPGETARGETDASGHAGARPEGLDADPALVGRVEQIESRLLLLEAAIDASSAVLNRLLRPTPARLPDDATAATAQTCASAAPATPPL